MSNHRWPHQRLIAKLNNLKAREKEGWKEKPLAQPNNQKEIGPKDRDVAVEWIWDLTQHFSFHPETFSLAASILDRFITSVKAQPKYLKCISISCFYLASKITEEENVVPCTSDLIQESGCGCRVCDVLRMERIILEKLSWEINAPTSLEYLHIFQELSFSHFTSLSSSVSPQHFAFLSIEHSRALCDYNVAVFGNAAIALAVISLDLEFLTGNPVLWTSITGRLQQLVEVKTPTFMKCRELLFHIFSLPNELPKEDFGYDSDKTLTASEGEEEMEVTEVMNPPLEVITPPPEVMTPPPEVNDLPMTSGDPKPRTYAEIVKHGAGSEAQSPSKPENDSSSSSMATDDVIGDDVIITSCGFQACMKGFPPIAQLGTQAR